MRMTRNRVGTHTIEHLVDGLADHIRFQPAQCDKHVGVRPALFLNFAGEPIAAAGGDMWKGALLISRLDFSVNSISIPVIR